MLIKRWNIIFFILYLDLLSSYEKVLVEKYGGKVGITAKDVAFIQMLDLLAKSYDLKSNQWYLVRMVKLSS